MRQKMSYININPLRVNTKLFSLIKLKTTSLNRDGNDFIILHIVFIGYF